MYSIGNFAQSETPAHSGSSDDGQEIDRCINELLEARIRERQLMLK